MFDPRSIKLSKEFKPVIVAAEKAGWTFRQAGNGGVLAISPHHPDERFYLPITSRRAENLAKAAMKMIAKSEDFSTEDVLDLMEGEQDTLGEVNDGPNPTITCRFCSAELTSYQGLSAHVRAAHPIEETDRDDEEGDVIESLEDLITEPSGLPTSNPEATSGTVIYMPYYAVLHRTADGTAYYESGTTLEVVEDDEVIGYACMYCHEIFENAYSVAPHYAFHVRKGEAEPVPTEREVAFTSDDTERRYLVGRRNFTGLAREIYDAIRANKRRSSWPDSTYAIVLAEHIQKARGEDTTPIEVEDTDLAPSEGGDVLAQIRALLGPDPEIEALRERAEKAEAEAEDEREKRKALRDLLADD